LALEEAVYDLRLSLYLEEMMIVLVGLLMGGVLSEEHFGYLFEIMERMRRQRVEPIWFRIFQTGGEDTQELVTTGIDRHLVPKYLMSGPGRSPRSSSRMLELKTFSGTHTLGRLQREGSQKLWQLKALGGLAGWHLRSVSESVC